jgi:hypothetical protein
MSALELADINKTVRDDEHGSDDGDGEERDASPAPAPQERDYFKGLVVHSPLRRRVLASASTPDKIQYEVCQLARLSAFELVRENNIAKHKETLKSLGLDKSFNELMGLKKGKTAGVKRKAVGKKGRKGKSKRLRGENGDDDEEDEDEDEEGSDSGEDEEDDTPVAPRAPRLQRTIASRTTAPKEWIVKAKKMLEKEELGATWDELVVEWYRREERKGFVSPVTICLTLS